LNNHSRYEYSTRGDGVPADDRKEHRVTQKKTKFQFSLRLLEFLCHSC